MTAATKPIPQPNTIAYKAAFILFKAGAMARRALMPLIDSGVKSHKIHDAIDAGWLVEDDHCGLDISKRAFNHLSGCEPDPNPEPYRGTPAQPNTIDLMARPPLSRKYILSSRGTRDDIPAWSQRTAPHFLTQA